MTKAEFLKELTKKLSRLGTVEREKFAAYYDEMLSDRMEEGMNEEEAVASLEPIEVISNRILSEGLSAPPLKKPDRVKTALTVAGAPLWAPLLLGLAAVAVALMVTIWAVWLALAATAIALFFAGIAASVVGLFYTIAQPASGMFQVGIGLVCLSLGLLLYQPVTKSAQWASAMTQKLTRKIRERKKGAA